MQMGPLLLSHSPHPIKPSLPFAPERQKLSCMQRSQNREGLRTFLLVARLLYTGSFLAFNRDSQSLDP